VLEGLRPLGFLYGILMAIGGLGRVAAAEGTSARAVRLLTAADAVWEQIGAVAPAAVRRGQVDAISKAREALDEAAFVAAEAAGRAYTLEEAVDDAASVAAGPAAHGELTERETEILRLVADDLTNKQIAARLFLSIRTVHAHLRSIYRKLGVGSRAAAGRRAGELGLL
jgi:DNA-binding NarL/FixJ family response regulator